MQSLNNNEDLSANLDLLNSVICQLHQVCLTRLTNYTVKKQKSPQHKPRPRVRAVDAYA